MPDPLHSMQIKLLHLNCPRQCHNFQYFLVKCRLILSRDFFHLPCIHPKSWNPWSVESRLRQKIRFSAIEHKIFWNKKDKPQSFSLFGCMLSWYSSSFPSCSSFGATPNCNFDFVRFMFPPRFEIHICGNFKSLPLARGRALPSKFSDTLWSWQTKCEGRSVCLRDL